MAKNSSTNNTDNNAGTSVPKTLNMSKKNHARFVKCLNLSQDKAAQETKEGKAAFGKCIEFGSKHCNCKNFGKFDAQTDACRTCNFSTSSICSFVSSDKKGKFVLYDAKSFPKLITKVARDKYGFTVSGNHTKLAALLEKAPLKMKDIKAALGNTYYECCNKFPAIFGKSDNKYFYIQGSAAEALSIKIDKDTAKAKKDTADKIEKEKKDKREKKEQAKKDALAKKEAESKAKADAKIKADAQAKKDAEKDASSKDSK